MTKTNSRSITLKLNPFPGERHRHRLVARKFVQTYTAPKYREWKQQAIDLLKEVQTRERIEGPVYLGLKFFVVRPKKPSKPYPRGDFDNYEKSIADAITQAEHIWKDDVQVVDWSGSKRYAPYGDPGWLEITITELDPSEI